MLSVILLMHRCSRHACPERKKEAPAIDEGEEARLCGGLWTKLLYYCMDSTRGMGASQLLNGNFFKKLFFGTPAGRNRASRDPSLSAEDTGGAARSPFLTVGGGWRIVRLSGRWSLGYG